MTIKCKNMTNALKAQKILLRNNVESEVQKINDVSLGGCVYCVIFDDDVFEVAINLMASAGVVLHKSEKNNYSYGGGV